jgi:mono/diheme cytochrome c family protein
VVDDDTPTPAKPDDATKPADPTKPGDVATTKPIDTVTKPGTTVAPPAPPSPTAPTPPAATTPPPATDSVAKPTVPGGDLTKAKATFQAKCSQCHSTDEVKRHPPKSAAGTTSLIKRMIEENDAVFSAAEIQLISTYINATYVGH